MPTSFSRTFPNVGFPEGKQRFYNNSPFEVGIDFRCHLDANLPLFWFPKSIKILQKSDSKRHAKTDWFLLRVLIHFGSVLGTKLEPCCPPRRPQDAPKTRPGRLQDTKRPPRRPRLPQGASKMTPRSPKKLPRSLQGWFWMVFSLIFISFLVDVSWIVGYIFPLQSFLGKGALGGPAWHAIKNIFEVLAYSL